MPSEDPMLTPDDWAFLFKVLLHPNMLVAYAVAGVIFWWGARRRR